MALKTPVIMLVDDDVDFLEMNQYILETKGYRVVCCSDPQKAFERMTKEKPDLIVTDLMMETLDAGFSFSRKIKDDPHFADIPVIIATAVGSQLGLEFTPRTSQELETMGVDAYFAKPVDPEAFIAKIDELLEPFRKEDHHE